MTDAHEDEIGTRRVEVPSEDEIGTRRVEIASEEEIGTRRVESTHAHPPTPPTATYPAPAAPPPAYPAPPTYPQHHGAPPPQQFGPPPGQQGFQGYPAYQGYPVQPAQQGGWTPPTHHVATRNTSAIVLLVVSVVSILAFGIIGWPSGVMAALALKDNARQPAKSARWTRFGWIVYAANFVIGMLLIIVFIWWRRAG